MKKYIVIIVAMVMASSVYCNHIEKASILKSSITYVDTPATVEVFEKMPSKAKEILHNEKSYGYLNGLFYVSVDTGYVETAAPVGIIVKDIPKDYQRVILSGQILYYSQGVFYQMLNKKAYRVCYGPIGAQVNTIPAGSQKVLINKQSCYLYNNAVFIKASTHSRNYYELIGYVQE